MNSLQTLACNREPDRAVRSAQRFKGGPIQQRSAAFQLMSRGRAPRVVRPVEPVSRHWFFADCSINIFGFYFR
jgi:hypothetical protein